MKTTIALIVIGLLLGGCMHTVSFDNQSRANWRATPTAQDIK